MTKQDFKTFINQNLKDLPLEKQEILLDKMLHKWLPDIVGKFNDKIEKNYRKCQKCGKYSIIKNTKSILETEVHHDVLVYANAGYGDDDEYADITYSICYSICPFCGGKSELNRYPLNVSNYHKRY